MPPHSLPEKTPTRAPVLVQEDHPLILALYGALTARAGFHDFLEKLTGSINGCAAQLLVVRKRPLKVDHLWYHGLSDEFLNWYLENNMIAQDVVTNHAAFQAPGVFQSALPLLPDFQPDKDYSKWENEQDMLDSAWLVVDTTESHTFILTIQRTVAQGPYLESELNSLNRLVPHIRQAVQLYRQFDLRDRAATSLAAIIDLLQDATFVMDSLGSIVYANKAARELIDQERGLAIRDDRLNFVEGDIQDAFFRASVKVVRSSMGKETYCRETLFLKRPDRKPLVFVVRPIDNHELSSGGALVTVYDPGNRSLPTAEHIAAYFSVTSAEAEVCECLINGLSLQEAAVRCGRAESTVRYQLKQVFQKTGCVRQGELVGAILTALLH